MFRFWHFLLNKNFLNIFLKIKREGLNDKKSLYWHLFILENSRKMVIFLGFTTYREKKEEKGGRFC